MTSPPLLDPHGRLRPRRAPGPRLVRRARGPRGGRRHAARAGRRARLAARPPAAPEPKAGPPPPSGRFFDTFDANQDGKVTKEEFTGDPEVFAFLDKNGDGVVTLDELGLPADYKPRPLPKEQDEQPPGGKGGAERSKRLEEWKARLAAWDTNKDGKVTKEEYKGKTAFETLDRNNDGVLTMDDLRGPGEGGGPGGAPDERRGASRGASRRPTRTATARSPRTSSRARPSASR